MSGCPNADGFWGWLGAGGTSNWVTGRARRLPVAVHADVEGVTHFRQGPARDAGKNQNKWPGHTASVAGRGGAGRGGHQTVHKQHRPCLAECGGYSTYRTYCTVPTARRPRTPHVHAWSWLEPVAPAAGRAAPADDTPRHDTTPDQPASQPARSLHCIQSVPSQP